MSIDQTTVQINHELGRPVYYRLDYLNVEVVSASHYRHSVKEESPNKNLSQDKIKRRFCIQEEDKQWFR